MPEHTVEEIRDALNKAWVLGERFKQQIEKQTDRRGDIKSRDYRVNRKYQSLTPSIMVQFLTIKGIDC